MIIGFVQLEYRKHNYNSNSWYFCIFLVFGDISGEYCQNISKARNTKPERIHSAIKDVLNKIL